MLKKQLLPSYRFVPLLMNSSIYRLKGHKYCHQVNYLIFPS